MSGRASASTWKNTIVITKRRNNWRLILIIFETNFKSSWFQWSAILRVQINFWFFSLTNNTYPEIILSNHYLILALSWTFNLFHVTSLFLYPFKTSENLRFSNVFGVGIERDQWHELMISGADTEALSDGRNSSNRLHITVTNRLSVL